MKFSTYWKGLAADEKRSFADRCNTTPGYLHLVAGGYKQNVGESLCMHIERESNGAVTVEEIRPDAPWEVIRGKCPKDQAA